MNARIDFNDNFGSLTSYVRNQTRISRWFPMLSHRVGFPQSLRIFFAVATGALAALAVLAGVTTLPETQQLAGLAALAAGIGLPMAIHSMTDEWFSRGLLRAIVALAAGVIAYQALSFGWAVLALSWSFLLAWAATDWIHAGASFRLATLLSGLLVLAGFALTQI